MKNILLIGAATIVLVAGTAAMVVAGKWNIRQTVSDESRSKMETTKANKKSGPYSIEYESSEAAYLKMLQARERTLKRKMNF